MITTKLISVAVKAGKESRASEWMDELLARQAECVNSLDREAMHYESIFRFRENGRLWLSWFSVQGSAGTSVESSLIAIDKIHVEFWNECVDRDVPRKIMEHVVSFVPASVHDEIITRNNRLTSNAP